MEEEFLIQLESTSFVNNFPTEY